MSPTRDAVSILGFPRFGVKARENVQIRRYFKEMILLRRLQRL